MENLSDAGPISRAGRMIAGGFILIPIAKLMAAWLACRRRPLGAGEFRAYLAAHEMLARRQALEPGREPVYRLAELARLAGIGQRRARDAVRRLEAAGLIRWGDAAIEFPEPPSGSDPAAAAADSIGRGRGSLAVPRRLLRFLARGARPALIATALGLIVRCLSRRKPGFDGRGRAKASWIARVFAVDPRAVKAARLDLVILGWIAPEPSPQATENRWGRIYRIDLAWHGPPTPEGEVARASCRESPPPPAPACVESPPLPINQDPLREENRHQDPAPGRRAGVEMAKIGKGEAISPSEPAKPNLPPPRLGDVHPEDLRDAARLMELHRQAVAGGLAGPSEADRLKFAAAAEHARAVGTINPGGLFARLIRRGWWHFATQADEEVASRRLKQHLYGRADHSPVLPIVGPRPPSSVPAPPSPDAVMVREVLVAVSRAGSRADPFPQVRAKDPSWTRERWDRALAELGDRVPASGTRLATPRPSSEVACLIRVRPVFP